MIRVLLADDEGLVRAGLRTILESDGDVAVVGEAGDGRELLALATADPPDVALVDVRMPGPSGRDGGGDGLDAVSALRARLPAVAVTVLTTFDEDDYVVRAVRAGAGGFLLKAADPRELLAAVRAAAAGEGYLSPRVTTRVLRLMREHDDGSGCDRDLVAALTERERDVLTLLARGLSNREIGRELFLAEGTVKAHLSTLLGRLGVDNRVRAAVVAHRAGLVRACS